MSSEMVKNKLPHEGPSVIFAFLFNVVVKLPIIIAVLLPLTLVETVVKKLTGKKKKKTPESTQLLGGESEEVPKGKTFTAANLSAREFDVVIFGATGILSPLLLTIISCSERFLFYVFAQDSLERWLLCIWLAPMARA